MSAEKVSWQLTFFSSFQSHFHSHKNYFFSIIVSISLKLSIPLFDTMLGVDQIIYFIHVLICDRGWFVFNVFSLSRLFFFCEQNNDWFFSVNTKFMSFLNGYKLIKFPFPNNSLINFDWTVHLIVFILPNTVAQQPDGRLTSSNKTFSMQLIEFNSEITLWLSVAIHLSSEC